MRNSKAKLLQLVASLNSRLERVQGDDLFIEVDVWSPGTGRLYQLTTYDGSCNLTCHQTLCEAISFVEGMYAGANAQLEIF